MAFQKCSLFGIKIPLLLFYLNLRSFKFQKWKIKTLLAYGDIIFYKRPEWKIETLERTLKPYDILIYYSQNQLKKWEIIFWFLKFKKLIIIVKSTEGTFKKTVIKKGKIFKIIIDS